MNLKTVNFEIMSDYKIFYNIQATKLVGCPYQKICYSKAEETNKKRRLFKL